ncbi:COP23 domain-containing protein [Picosynechococcus sp. OG1]|uniref:COP23 domain-containing protein n=1 Tax=Picosynechococcus sp. OG1 TaxID=1938863 RepID=UPI001F24CFFF|nr:COP23 domain-containing protein [Picosynechococcus sp. OG1]
MSKGLHTRTWLKIGIVGLEILGFAASSAIAQVPPDIVVDTDSNTGNTPGDVIYNSGDRRFVCQYDQGQYTVMYQPESRPGEVYPWAIPRTMGAVGMQSVAVKKLPAAWNCTGVMVSSNSPLAAKMVTTSFV